MASSGPSSLLIVEVVSCRLCVGNQLSAGGGAEARGPAGAILDFDCRGCRPLPVSALVCFMAKIQDGVVLGAGDGDGGGDACLSETATASCGLGICGARSTITEDRFPGDSFNTALVVVPPKSSSGPVNQSRGSGRPMIWAGDGGSLGLRPWATGGVCRVRDVDV